MIWDLESGQDLAAWLQSEIRPTGWACGMTGSVLFDKCSLKDLDIILFPMGVGTKTTKDQLKQKLVALGFECVLDEAHTKMKWLVENNSRDTKHVEIWSFASRRVDFFFLE